MGQKPIVGSNPTPSAISQKKCIFFSQLAERWRKYLQRCPQRSRRLKVRRAGRRRVAHRASGGPRWCQLLRPLARGKQRRFCVAEAAGRAGLALSVLYILVALMPARSRYARLQFGSGSHRARQRTDANSHEAVINHVSALILKRLNPLMIPLLRRGKIHMIVERKGDARHAGYAEFIIAITLSWMRTLEYAFDAVRRRMRTA